MENTSEYIPYYITVFGSWKCTYACPGCYHTSSEKWKQDWRNKPRFMPFSTFKRIVDEFKQYKTQIGLYSPGENFLNPDVYAMVEYAETEGCRVEIDTTGACVDPVRLADTGISNIMFSIDGMTQDVYGGFRKNGRLENVQNRLERFTDEVDRRGMKTNIVVKYLVNAITETQMDEAVAYYSKLPNVTLKFDFFMPPETFENMQQFNGLYTSLESYEKWRPRIKTNFDIYEPDYKKGVAVHKVVLNGERGPFCPNVFSGITIDTDGRVIPCCKLDFQGLGEHDPMYLGSIFEPGGALGAFHSDRAKQFRKKYMESKGNYYRCEYCRHNFNLKEKASMSEKVRDSGYQTMLSGILKAE
ncbi:MAG: radical SAM protein [Desulfobacter sp.]|nr:MAG: radical SAM protein [Desulfobacter sp.]